MKAKNQYLEELISRNKGYHLKPRKQKSNILDEYCRITGQNRIAVSRKIRTGDYIRTMRKETGREKRTRSSLYDGDVIAHLIRLWNIFDHPCGQRLAPIIRTEVDRLRRFGELTISEDMASRLKRISPRTIDAKLKKHKEKELLQRKYSVPNHPLLYQKIPVKLSSEQGRGIGDSIQIDLVEHCGQSAHGPFLSTVSITDVGSGWWEGEVVMTKGMYGIQRALGCAQYRFPFAWKEMHTDNGTEFINTVVWRYAKRHKLDFSRSRPYAKNDNCFVEQKNSTHVRKIVGHCRYDTRSEYDVLKELYRNDLRLYKNFFQPIIPLISKERIGGHIKRKYGEPKTPYQRIMDDTSVSADSKEQLTEIYQRLNPAQLKRNIRQRQDLLYRAYRKKQSVNQSLVQKVDYTKKLTPHSETFLIAEPMRVQQHSLIA